MGAQELVELRQLGAGARGLAAGALGRRLGLAAGARAPPRRRRPPRAAPRRRPPPPRPGPRARCAAFARRACSSASSRSSRSRRSSASWASSASSAAIRSAAPSSPVSAAASASSAASSARRRPARSSSVRRGLPRRLLAQADPLARRARGVEPVRQPSRSVPRAASACSACSRRSATARSSCSVAAAADRAAAAAASASASAGARRAHVLAHERPQRLVGLALEPLVQLGRLGLALERPQPGARLALDVERAVEVVLRPGQLELRAAAPLAVLAEPGRLLDQHPPVARLGGHDRLHAALRDDRVHLLAQPGVRQQLEHVGQAAAGAVDAVLALPRAVEPAHDRDLARGQVDGAAGVVEHHLDLRLGARLDAVRAGEDHVLHRLAAHRDRRLLAHRPQHGVGDVRLAGAVRARRRPTRPARSPAACGPGTT